MNKKAAGTANFERERKNTYIVHYAYIVFGHMPKAEIGKY